MAQFEGTIKEFNKFIGAYARLKVAFMAAKYKKLKGGCEECGTTQGLDAAHVKGKGRALLIATILSEFMEGDVIRIDLNEFEERFVQIHLPLETTIRVLCKSCHRAYDKVHKEVTTPDSLPIKDESAIIEEIIQHQMNKSKAMQLAYTKGITSLTNTNTIFSNIIEVQDGWWLQPSNDKFKSALHIILNHSRLNKLYIFKLPANTITNPSLHFKQRNDKYRANCSDVYLPTSGTKFKEKMNGFDFTSYLAETIDY